MNAPTRTLAWTLKATAEALGMPYSAVHTAAKAGRMKSYRVGSRYYVEPDDALEWLRSHPPGTTDPDR